MQKSELLNQIAVLAGQHAVSKEEVVAAFNRGSSHASKDASMQTVTLVEVMYYIGGAIVFMGIAVLIWQNWTTLNMFTKILATLGSAVAAYLMGVMFSFDQRLGKLSQAFFFLSAILMPMGLIITLDQAGLNTETAATNVLISTMLVVVYLASYFAFRKDIFLVFTILFATWLFFALTSYIVGANPLFDWWRYYNYRVLAAGLAYISLGYFFQFNGKPQLTGFLYGFGIFWFLGAALMLGGWSPQQYMLWELLFPGLVLGVLFISVYLKSKAFLVFGAIYLMAYILKITAEYFTSGLGWPLSLVLAGLVLIFVGYCTYYVDQKYITGPKKLAA